MSILRGTFVFSSGLKRRFLSFADNPNGLQYRFLPTYDDILEYTCETEYFLTIVFVRKAFRVVYARAAAAWVMCARFSRQRRAEIARRMADKRGLEAWGQYFDGVFSNW